MLLKPYPTGVTQSSVLQYPLGLYSLSSGTTSTLRFAIQIAIYSVLCNRYTRTNALRCYATYSYVTLPNAEFYNSL